MAASDITITFSGVTEIEGQEHHLNGTYVLLLVETNSDGSCRWQKVFGYGWTVEVYVSTESTAVNGACLNEIFSTGVNTIFYEGVISNNPAYDGGTAQIVFPSRPPKATNPYPSDGQVDVEKSITTFDWSIS